MTSLPRGCLPAALLLFFPASTQGQSLIHIDRPLVSVGTEFDGRWVSQVGYPDVSRLREFFQGRVSGSVGRGSVISFVGRIRPYIGQGWQNPAVVEADLAEDGVSGAVELRVLPGRAIEASVSADRQNQFQPDRFGGSRQFRLDRRTVRLWDRNPLLPSSAVIEDRTDESVFLSGLSGNTLSLQRRVKRVRYEAHNWKTRVFFQQLNVNETVDGNPVDYVQRQAIVGNKQRWGKGSVVDNQLLFRGRSIDRESRALTLRNFTHLQHSDGIASEYEWERVRESGDVWSGERRLARVRLRLQPAFGPSGYVEWSRRHQQLDDFRRQTTRISPSFSLAHTFSMAVSVSGNFNLGYSWDTQGTAVPTFGYVVQERHIVGPDGRIQLESPFAIVESVVVHDAASGALYDPLFDYRVVEDGPFLLLVTLPGGRLEEGSEVLIDYRYYLAPEISSRVLDFRTALTVRVGALSLTYRRVLRNDLDELPSGMGRILQDFDQEQFGAQYSGLLLRTRVSAYGGLATQRAQNLEVRQWVGTLSAQSRLSPRMRSATTGRYSQNVGGEQPYTTVEFEGRIDWKLRSYAAAEAFVSYFQWNDQSRSQRGTGVGVQFNLEADGADGYLRLERNNWIRGDHQTEYRVSFRFERGF